MLQADVVANMVADEAMIDEQDKQAEQTPAAAEEKVCPFWIAMSLCYFESKPTPCSNVSL